MDFATNVDRHILLSGIFHGGRDIFVDCIDIINETYFEDIIENFIFLSYKEIFNKNLEFTISNVFSFCSQYGLSEESYSKIREILSHDVNQKETRFYAIKLKKMALIKESISLHNKCKQELKSLNGSEDFATIFSISESSIFDLVKKHSGEEETSILLGDKVTDMIEQWAKHPCDNIGIPTPWPLFNQSIGGGMRTGVTLIGARAGKGKSTVGLITAVYVSELNIPVLVLDSEMEIGNIMPRVLANMSEVSIKSIETGKFVGNLKDRNAINKAAEKLKTLSFHYRPIAGKSFDEILSIIRRWIYTTVGIQSNGKANECLVIYDYFKLMDSGEIKSMQEFQAMGFQISKLTDFCKEYDFPCMAFVQLNRDGESKEGSDVVAQSDRLLWLCNSFSLFKPKSTDEQSADQYKKGNYKLKTIKSRYGGEHSFDQYINMNMAAFNGQLTEIVK